MSDRRGLALPRLYDPAHSLLCVFKPRLKLSGFLVDRRNISLSLLK